MQWLEDIGPDAWTPVAKADYAAILAEAAAEAFIGSPCRLAARFLSKASLRPGS